MLAAWSPRTIVIPAVSAGLAVASRAVRAMAARRTIITSSSTLSTSAAGGIAATPRADQSTACASTSPGPVVTAAPSLLAWAMLSTKLTAAAPASSALGPGDLPPGPLGLVDAEPQVRAGGDRDERVDQQRDRQAVTLTANVVASVIVLGVLGTGIAYVLNYRLIADEGATAASTVTYLIPIVAVILGVLILPSL
jgi:hypothetical protein